MYVSGLPWGPSYLLTITIWDIKYYYKTSYICVNLTRILSFSSPFTLIQSVQNDRKEEYSSEFKILKWHSTVWNWTQWSITEIKWSNAFEFETHTTPNEMFIKPGGRLVGWFYGTRARTNHQSTHCDLIQPIPRQKLKPHDIRWVCTW